MPWIKKQEREALRSIDDHPARAAELFESVLAEFPGRLSALRGYARLLMKRREFQAARSYWERIAKLAPRDIEARLGIARAHQHMTQFPEAIASVRAALRIDPKHAEAERLRQVLMLAALAQVATRSTGESAAHKATSIAALEGAIGDHPLLSRIKSLVLGADEQTSPQDHQVSRTDNGDDEAEVRAERGDGLRLLGRREQMKHRAAIDSHLQRAVSALRQKTAAGVSLDNDALSHELDVSWRQSTSDPHYLDWVKAARLAGVANDTAAVLEFCERAALDAAFDTPAMEAIAEVLVAHQLYDAAAGMWRTACASGLNLRARLGLLRVLDASDRRVELLDEALRSLKDASPYDRLTARNQNHLVAIVRRLVQTAIKAELGERLASHKVSIAERNPGSAFAAWVLGTFEFARFDNRAALDLFEQALKLPPMREGVVVDLRAEIALVHARHYMFSEAGNAVRNAPAGLLKTKGYYRQHLAIVEPVLALCGNRHPLRYPDCVFDVILDEIAADPLTYEPRRGHVITVSSSLAQGGAERQTLTVLERMTREPRLQNLALYVRSIDSEHKRFLLSEAQRLPLELTIYGENWSKRSDLDAELPQLAHRKRLVAAIEMLPHNSREDIIRLCRRFLAERPQAVHLRQDLHNAALACAIAGVPRYIVHRGSLSPDRWGHNPLKLNVHIRPMRHAYRRLLERPEFMIVNNSRLGAETDRTWTEWPDPGRFRVIYNALNFDELGPNLGRNMALRAQLGIPDDAFVIGGAFRFATPKRPMLWIDAARHVARAEPTAHFLIIGDGDKRQDVLAFAQQHGFAERLHLPGRVSDVGAWFRAMDLQLLTSDREGLPNVLIEAQHFGVPVVTSDVGGANETIEAGITGHLIPPESDAVVFAEAVLAAIRNRSWLAAAGARSPAFVHGKFKADRIVEQLLECYGVVPESSPEGSQI